MYLSYPNVGWFDLALGESYQARVSYLCFPFGDFASLFRKAFIFNAPSTVELDGEGRDSLLVYNHTENTLEQWDENTQKKYSVKISKQEIVEKYLPIFGIQAFYLYYGSNILHFSTYIPHIDFKGVTEENEEDDIFMRNIIHQKENSDKIWEFKKLRNAIANYTSILNITHNIAIYRGNPAKINSDWLNAHITLIKHYMSLINLDTKDENVVKDFLNKIVSGDFQSVSGINTSSDVKKMEFKNPLMFFMAINGVDNLLPSTSSDDYSSSFNNVVDNIIKNDTFIDNEKIISFILDKFSDENYDFDTNLYNKGIFFRKED